MSEQVAIPVSVGDIVFVVPDEWEKKYWGCVVGEYSVTNILVSQNKKGKWTKKFRVCEMKDGKTRDRQKDFAFDDIGKVAFFNKEDAERVLKET